ncbi:MAG TPA: hypothetical protein VMD57_04930, partial [Candidatus Baltobacteraceae bacterium]|nr:hypothetical protein [Candidatus Baltobacteraceae bacterium]
MPRALKINGYRRRRRKIPIKNGHCQLPAAGLSPTLCLSTPEQYNDDWLVWQLVDSTFPIGGFAHSLGLEAAWQHGEVRGREDLVSFLEASLHQLGHAALPFVTAAFDEPEKLGEL